jgi:hypothetical protein
MEFNPNFTYILYRVQRLRTMSIIKVDSINLTGTLHRRDYK